MNFHSILSLISKVMFINVKFGRVFFIIFLKRPNLFAYWLRSSVVSVLFSVTTEMSS